MKRQSESSPERAPPVCNMILTGRTQVATDHAHDHDHGRHGPSHEHGQHGHSHERMEHAGRFHERPVSKPAGRNFSVRAFTVGIGGPVGSGKTALMLQLCRKLRDKKNIAAVTNDIFTREDGEFLTRNSALEPDRIVAVETGGCPHAAIREDISANLQAHSIRSFASPVACCESVSRCC